jgi:hypothetical protein
MMGLAAMGDFLIANAESIWVSAALVAGVVE